MVVWVWVGIHVNVSGYVLLCVHVCVCVNNNMAQLHIRRREDSGPPLFTVYIAEHPNCLSPLLCSPLLCRMLDEHFMDQMNQIVKLCPLSRQTMLFSATMTDNVSVPYTQAHMQDSVL